MHLSSVKMKVERDADSAQELLMKKNPTKGIFWFQLGILRCFGLIYPEKISTCYRFPVTFIATVFLCGGWMMLGVGLATIYIKLFAVVPGESEKRTTPLLDVIALYPLIGASIRGVIPLTIVFFFKRQKLTGLLENMNLLVATAISDGVLRRCMTRWKWQIGALTVYTILYPIATYPLGWVEAFSTLNWTMTEGNPLEPLPPVLPPWAAVLVSEMFITVPSLLSMQLSILLIGCALILTSCIQQILEELQRERQRFLSYPSRLLPHPLENRVEKTLPLDYSHSESALQTMLHLHSSIVSTCQEVNGIFGLIFAVSYVCDFIGMVALATTWFMNTASVTYNIMHMINVLLQTVNQAVCSGLLLIPLFRMHEKSLEIHDGLCRYADAAVNALQNDEGNKLWKILHLFLAKSRDQTIVIEGCHLVHATRQLFVATFTICASFVVIAKEFLQKSSLPDPGESVATVVNKTLHYL